MSLVFLQEIIAVKAFLILILYYPIMNKLETGNPLCLSLSFVRSLRRRRFYFFLVKTVYFLLARDDHHSGCKCLGTCVINQAKASDPNINHFLRLSHFLSLPLPHSLSLSLSHSTSLFLTLSLSLALSHTLSHTHTFSLSHSPVYVCLRFSVDLHLSSCICVERGRRRLRSHYCSSRKKKLFVTKEIFLFLLIKVCRYFF